MHKGVGGNIRLFMVVPTDFKRVAYLQDLPENMKRQLLQIIQFTKCTGFKASLMGECKSYFLRYASSQLQTVLVFKMLEDVAVVTLQ